MAVKGNVIEHLDSGIKICTSKICSACPYKLYSKSDTTIKFGIGAIVTNVILVLPEYDVNRKVKLDYPTIYTLLRDRYRKLMGIDISTDCYVTRLVKCSAYSIHNLTAQAFAPCSNYLNYEIGKIDADKIIFFGDSYDNYFLNNPKGNALYFRKRVFKVTSPGVLFYPDSPYVKRFDEELLEALNAY